MLQEKSCCSLTMKIWNCLVIWQMVDLILVLVCLYLLENRYWTYIGFLTFSGMHSIQLKMEANI